MKIRILEYKNEVGYAKRHVIEETSPSPSFDDSEIREVLRAIN